MRAAACNVGVLTPRRSREAVERSRPIAFAISASEMPRSRANAKKVSVMTQNVHPIHTASQENCVPSAVAHTRAGVHNSHMATGDSEIFLREWRKFRGLTLEAAADQAGLSHSQLSRIERGQSDYTKSTLQALAAVYECAPSDLVGRDPNAAEAVVIDIWSRISVEKRPQAQQILETFAGAKKN